VEERAGAKRLDVGVLIFGSGGNAAALCVNGGAHQQLLLLIVATDRRDVNGFGCS
jgi:hypothetical protein